MVWIFFIRTGSIVHLSLFLSKFTAENYLDKPKPKNEFDALFMYSVAQSVVVYAIAILFFMLHFTLLLLSIDILIGTMWISILWIVKNNVGIIHTRIRTVAILAF